MQLYQEFMNDIELVRGGSSQHVSEVDLSILKDLRVVMTGLASATDAQAVTVHFGSSDFSGKSSRSSQKAIKMMRSRSFWAMRIAPSRGLPSLR